MNLSPTDQLFSHIVGHTEKLLCRGVRFVLLCCDIPDLFHSPIENRTKERKTQWVEILYDGNFLSLQKKNSSPIYLHENVYAGQKIVVSSILPEI